MVSPEVVIFAIQAGVQLYGAGRRAYVDGTRGRALALPLPRAPGIEFDSAHNWFTLDPQGIAVVERTPRLARLLLGANAAERGELVDLYIAFRAEVDPVWPEGSGARGQFSSEQLAALLEIRQWADGESGRPVTALQQVAGTLINLAVDYFAHTPGAVSPQRPAGRALLAFLNAIDDTDFAGTAVTEVAGELMIAVLDAVAETPALAGGGKREQALVQNVSHSLAASAKLHLANAPTTERWEAATWLRLATRALVQGGAEAVLANPVVFLDIEAGAESNALTRVGRTVADLLIGEERLTFRRLLSGEGLSEVVRASLDAIAANPDLLRVGNDGLKNILVAVAADVSRTEGTLGPDLFPDLTRRILEHSAANMDVVWGKDFQTADRHLLVSASRTLLAALAAPPPAGASWKPRFTRAQLLVLVDTVFDEVADNPDWVVRRAGAAAPPLGVAVAAMLESMRRLDGHRIGAEAGATMLRAGLRAVAVQLPLLSKLPPGTADAGKVALGAALDAMFSELAAKEAGGAIPWRLGRSSLLRGAVEVGLAELARAGAGATHIDALRAASHALADGTTPADLDAFALDLRQRLAAA